MKITLSEDINLNKQISLFEPSLKPNWVNEFGFYDALYNFIVENKSIKGIDIEIPPMEIKCSCTYFSNNGKSFKGKGGIYFLSDEEGKLLNIGNTSDLYDRVYKKWIGKNGGSKADYFFCDLYHNVSLFCESNSVKRRLYEVYLINKHQPPYNYQYNYYDKSTYIETLRRFEEKESKRSIWLGGFKRNYWLL